MQARTDHISSRHLNRMITERSTEMFLRNNLPWCPNVNSLSIDRQCNTGEMGDGGGVGLVLFVTIENVVYIKRSEPQRFQGKQKAQSQYPIEILIVIVKVWVPILIFLSKLDYSTVVLTSCERALHAQSAHHVCVSVCVIGKLQTHGAGNREIHGMWPKKKKNDKVQIFRQPEQVYWIKTRLN